MAEHDLLPHRGPLFKRLLPFTRYLVTNLTMAAGWILFHVLNRTVAFGKENVGEEMNTLLLSNHQSMIDGFVIGFVWYPRSWLKPSLMPWNPAAAENFYRNPVLAWLSDNWKCMPIKPGRKDFGAMTRMVHALEGGVMTIFPEGTRTRDGGLLPPRSGIAFVMHRVRPRAVPVCMDGMNRVLGVGTWLPRIGQTVYLYYGRPVPLDDLYALPSGREAADKIIERVFVRIRRQQKVLERYRRIRARRLACGLSTANLYRP